VLVGLWHAHMGWLFRTNPTDRARYAADLYKDRLLRWTSRLFPLWVVIDPEGRLLYQGAIDDRPTADPADIADATNYLRQALDEAMAGEAVSVPRSKPYGCSMKYP